MDISGQFAISIAILFALIVCGSVLLLSGCSNNEQNSKKENLDKAIDEIIKGNIRDKAAYLILERVLGTTIADTITKGYGGIGFFIETYSFANELKIVADKISCDKALTGFNLLMYIKYGDDFNVFVPETIRGTEMGEKYSINVKNVALNIKNTYSLYYEPILGKDFLTKDHYTLEDYYNLEKNALTYNGSILRIQSTIGDIKLLSNSILKYYFSYLSLFI